MSQGKQWGGLFALWRRSRPSRQSSSNVWSNACPEEHGLLWYPGLFLMSDDLTLYYSLLSMCFLHIQTHSHWHDDALCSTRSLSFLVSAFLCGTTTSRCYILILYPCSAFSEKAGTPCTGWIFPHKAALFANAFHLFKRLWHVSPQQNILDETLRGLGLTNKISPFL